MSNNFNGNIKESKSDTIIDPSTYADWDDTSVSTEECDDCPQCVGYGDIDGKLCRVCKGSGSTKTMKKK